MLLLLPIMMMMMMNVYGRSRCCSAWLFVAWMFKVEAGEGKIYLAYPAPIISIFSNLPGSPNILLIPLSERLEWNGIVVCQEIWIWSHTHDSFQCSSSTANAHSPTPHVQWLANCTHIHHLYRYSLQYTYIPLRACQITYKLATCQCGKISQLSLYSSTCLIFSFLLSFFPSHILQQLTWKMRTTRKTFSSSSFLLSLSKSIVSVCVCNMSANNKQCYCLPV